MSELITRNESVTEYFQTVIAGKKIEIECKYRDVFRLCLDYICKFDQPDIVLSVSWDEIDHERSVAEITDKLEKNVKVHSEAELETMAIYRKLSEILLDDNFLLIHGAAVAADNQCFLFMAKSGTGKTTHVEKWLSKYPETFVVNGDKPLIDVDHMLVYGTPWCGKENLGTNTSVTLSGLIWLERGNLNEIEQITFSRMLPFLIKQCYIPQKTASVIKVMRLLEKLQGVPCWHLRCNVDDRAGEVSYSALVTE